MGSTLSIRESEFWARVRSLEALESDLSGTEVLGYGFHRIGPIPTRWGDKSLHVLTLEPCAHWSDELAVFFVAISGQAGATSAETSYGVVHVVGYSRETERDAEIEVIRRYLR